MIVVIVAALLVVVNQQAAVVAPKVNLSTQDSCDLSRLTKKLPLEYLAILRAHALHKGLGTNSEGKERELHWVCVDDKSIGQCVKLWKNFSQADKKTMMEFAFDLAEMVLQCDGRCNTIRACEYSERHTYVMLRYGHLFAHLDPHQAGSRIASRLVKAPNTRDGYPVTSIRIEPIPVVAMPQPAPVVIAAPAVTSPAPAASVKKPLKKKKKK